MYRLTIICLSLGPANMIWPGLNSPVAMGKELYQHRKLPEDPDYKAKLLKMRDEMGAFRRVRLTPLQRGWTGDKLPGRSIGAPDPVGEGNYKTSFNTS